MLIINNIQITKRDFKDLLRTTTIIRKHLETNDASLAIAMLKEIEDVLNYNLKKDEENK